MLLADRVLSGDQALAAHIKHFNWVGEELFQFATLLTESEA